MTNAPFTTADQFSAMRGHVANGASVLLRNGEVLTVRPTMHGWQLVDWDERPVSDRNLTAFGVECFVVARDGH